MVFAVSARPGLGQGVASRAPEMMTRFATLNLWSRSRTVCRCTFTLAATCVLLTGFFAERSVANTASSRLSNGILFALAGPLAALLERSYETRLQ